MKTKKEPIVRSIVWQCVSCPTAGDMKHPEMMDHLKTVHGFDAANTKVKKSLVQALDGSDWYSNVFEYTIPTPSGEVKALKSDSGPRHKHDPMRFED